MTTQQTEALTALIERFRGLHFDHAPDGWPAVRTREITALLGRITELESQLAQRFAAADSVPAGEREQERIAFKDAHRHLDLDEVPDAWGRPMFKHSHVEASWLGWVARASHGQAPAQTADSQLLKFYGVTTDAELIAAQAAHIEKLQARLTKTAFPRF